MTINNETGLSIITATFNEVKNIEIMYKNIFQELEIDKKIELNVELIIVDDDSPDQTFKRALDISCSDERVRPILRKSNKGLGQSVFTGIKSAKYEYIVIMDADLSHNPYEIIEMYNTMRLNSLDMVWCSRYIPGGMVEKNISGDIQFFLSRMFNKLISIILKLPICDTTNGFFMFRKNCFNQEQLYKCFNGYGDFSFLLLYKLIQLKKVNVSKIVEIPSIYRERKFGDSKTKLFKVGFDYCKSALYARLFW